MSETKDQLRAKLYDAIRTAAKLLPEDNAAIGIHNVAIMDLRRAIRDYREGGGR